MSNAQHVWVNFITKNLPVGLFLCCFLIVTSSRRTSRHVMCTHITDNSSYDSIAVVILAAEKMRDLLTEAKG